MKTIRMLRQEKGISIKELANRTGLTFATIQRWETGKGMPYVDNAIVVAKVLETSVEKIIWDQDEHTKKEINKILES